MLLFDTPLVEDVVFEKAEDFRFDPKTTLCFTGHRPFHLPGNGDLQNVSLRRIMSRVHLGVKEAIDAGYTTFVSGMALGVDMWCARIIMELKPTHPELNLVCVLPFKGQDRDYPSVDKYEYDVTLHAADQVICLSDHYHSNCMRVRNQYMVDHSSKIIGVVKHFKSGSGMTINYAKKKGIDILLVDVNKDELLYDENQLELTLPDD